MTRPTLAVIGGTGALGSGLAAAWARAGYPVVIGSRDAERAEATAADLAAQTGGQVRGLEQLPAAQAGDIVVLTVRYANHAETLDLINPALAGKLVIDTTVPLVPPKVMRVQLPAAGCAAVETQNRLGDSIDVCSAFHNVSAEHLHHGGAIDCDVLVFGDKAAARERVLELVQAAGLKGWHGGALANSAAAEALTSVLIFINKHYQSPGAGIRLTV